LNQEHIFKISGLLASVFFVCLSLPAAGQVDAVYDQGMNGLFRQLQRLQTTAAVLHTGAHPDDEDSALVAYHARRVHARTGYLSLTRGSGGQNIIGAEQSDALGVIRTEELLQARRLDGASQYFTRATDFGFSKTLSEAQRVWPENAVLADMVYTIRNFRPDVIVSRWNGTATDGHGHHQFAGYLTPLAIEAAADASRFPEQLVGGLNPWQVQKLYVSERNATPPPDSSLLRINTGEYDPLSGQSYFQIGMQGRSQQKTQQMGSLELQGSQYSVLRQVSSNQDTVVPESSVFDGINTSVIGIARFEPQASAGFIEKLGNLQDLLASVLRDFEPLEPDASVPSLAAAHTLVREALAAAQGQEARRLLEEKRRELEQALLLAAGIRIDALIDRETLEPGSVATVAVRAYMPEMTQARIIESTIEGPAGWLFAPSPEAVLTNEISMRRADHFDAQHVYRVSVPRDAQFTQPYWLVEDKQGSAYAWGNDYEAKTLPFAKPLLVASVTVEIGGIEISAEREVEYRQLDRVRGELRRRVDVVPSVSVEPATDLLVIPQSIAAAPIPVVLTIQNNSDEAISGTAQLSLPPGWQLEPSFADFTLAPAPASAALAFTVRLPEDVEAARYRLLSSANVAGTRFDQTVREIAYPHIRTHRTYQTATTEIQIVDVAVADVQVGYIMGSGDTVPAALRRMGVNVSLLSDADLTSGDLSQFDTLIIGIRASQTREAFVANNARLLAFVEQGGTLIVQYQQPDFASKGLAPYPVSMDGNVRVVDENAAITLLAPDHPVFNFPNRIGVQDFDGWVQERNNYNFTDFDRENFTPLTEAHDEGEPASDGAMLHTRIGEGHYVYTSYSWFRQLPNGVPGAYRIFANLLSLTAAPEQMDNR
jgi:LmbE family N-acetylglucosaminyl deacetylase